MGSEAVLSLGAIKLGDQFELDAGAYELRRAGQPLRLGRIPMELLFFLVEQHGRLVTREQIVAKIWGNDVYLDTDNSINAAIRKIRQVLDDNPDEPRFIQTVIGRGYRFVGAIETPQTEPEVAPEPIQPVEKQKPARLRAAAILILVVAVLGGVSFRFRERLLHPAVPIDSASIQARPSVAVLGFKNLSDKEDEAWISTALSELVSADLSSGQKLRLIPGENVARMKSDLSLSVADLYSAETLTKIRQNVNSDLVVFGSYLATGEGRTRKIHVNLKVQDAKNGETITVLSEDGTEAELAPLVSRSADSFRKTLRLDGASSDEDAQAVAALPGNAEGARYYAEGLAKWRSFDPLAATELFRKAIAADPSHALSHAALAECLATLGYDLKAQEEAKRAFDLSAKLPREHQLAIEGRYRAVTHNWPRAIQVYQMLWEFFPDNVDYGLNLAKAQSSGGSGKDAIATIDALMKQKLSADPRIDLVDAMAADRLGDLRREESAAARAVEKGRRSGARSVTAGGLLTRGSALIGLGDNTNAASCLKEAQEIFSSLGDQQGVARVLNNLGIIARHQGNYPEAQKLLEQALEISQQIGSQLSIRQALNNLANVVWLEGDTAQALAYHQQALKLSRELGDKAREGISLSNIAGLLILQGKLKETRQMYEESMRIANEIADREGVGLSAGNIADTLTRMGQLESAKKQAESALSTDRQVGNKSLEGYMLCQLGAILVAQGDLETGRSRYQECADLRYKLGEKTEEAEAQLALAQIRLDSGDPRGAEEEARKIAASVHSSGPTDNEALSYSSLASALLAQGKLAEAREASAKSVALVPKALDVATQLQVEMVDAYVSGRSATSSSDANELANATRALEASLAKTKRFGYGGLELEARLRLAELDLQAGKALAGRSRMEQLRSDAQAQGFLLVARKAAGALREKPFRASGKVPN